MEDVISRRRYIMGLAAAGLALSLPLPVTADGRFGRNYLEPCTVYPKYPSHVKFYVHGRYRYCDTNDIPDHKVGRFPDRGCPNAIRPHNLRFRMPLRPRLRSETTRVENWEFYGVALDGVVFDPGTAGFWHHQRGSIWNFAVLTGFGNLGLDQSHGHVQSDGMYHYHGLPTVLVHQLHGWNKVTLIGYAADGFPIYAPWGYSRANDANSEVKLLRSSYRLKEGNRPSPPAGPGGRYDGRYTGDFEYVEGYGDLDEANGRTGVTPEYPDGTYYYVVTEEFPFIGRLFRGRPDYSFRKHAQHLGRPRHSHGGGGRGRGPRGMGPPFFPPGRGF